MLLWNKHALRLIAPNGKSEIINQLSLYLGRYFSIYNISDRLEQAQFIAQIAHESAGFRAVEEYGNKAYFDKYDGRMGNAKGEGYKFRGRGLIQLTGRNNYEAYGYADEPDEVCEFPAALEVCFKYWIKRKLGQYARKDDIRAVTKRINGGYNGLADRKRYLKLAKRIIRAAGDKWLAANLKKLGYSDVIEFQKANGLKADAIAGTLTREKIQTLLRNQEKTKSESNATKGLSAIGAAGAGSVIQDAASQIEPLAAISPYLNGLFIALTLLGAGFIVWSIIKKQVLPEEVRG